MLKIQLDAAGNFGERLRAARQAKGLTQQELAQMSHVALPTVGLWERGGHLPSYRRKVFLAELLGVDPDWLIRGEGE